MFLRRRWMQVSFKQQITWRSGRLTSTTWGDVWISAKVGAAVCETEFVFVVGYKYLLNFTRCSSRFGVPFFAESSKELEELRGAFARSLDYMKQDVEESRWLWVQLRFLLNFFSMLGFLFSSLSFVTVGFGESGDPSCLIMQIWARIEVSSVTMTTIFKSQMSAMLSPKKPEMKKVFLTILNHSHSHIFDNMSKNVQKNLFFCILILKKSCDLLFLNYMSHTFT